MKPENAPLVGSVISEFKVSAYKPEYPAKFIKIPPKKIPTFNRYFLLISHQFHRGDETAYSGVVSSKVLF